MIATDPTIEEFTSFLEVSPTAWHAVKEASQKLQAQGFKQLDEQNRWDLVPGQRYFVNRHGSSLCAFVLPQQTPSTLRLIGAHTDSPALKLKPNSEYRKKNMIMLGVEVYGGPLLNAWLNRDLVISGVVHHTDSNGSYCHSLVHLTDHPVVIPQLAIHLDRKISSDGLKLDKQKHLAALAGTCSDQEADYRFLEDALSSQIDLGELLGFELFLIPHEPPRLVGRNQQLISGYRIDNLSGVHAGLTALLGAKEPAENTIKMAIFWDNEEVGSQTAQGAGSPFLSDTLERISLALGMDRESYLRLLSQSLCFSVDSAHALHPNHSDRHEPQHQPLLGHGTVLKINAQQRYASSAQTATVLERAAREQGLKLQKFVSRTDMPCGSTIGPISSTRTGIPTVDLGIPQLSMHSIREVAAWKDQLEMCQLLEAALSV